MQNDLFGVAFSKASGLAWRVLLQAAPPLKPVWISLFHQGKAGESPGWVPGEPRGECQRRVLESLDHHRDFCPAHSAQGAGLGSCW